MREPVKDFELLRLFLGKNFFDFLTATVAQYFLPSLRRPKTVLFLSDANVNANANFNFVGRVMSYQGGWRKRVCLIITDCTCIFCSTSYGCRKSKVQPQCGRMKRIRQVPEYENVHFSTDCVSRHSWYYFCVRSLCMTYDRVPLLAF